MRFILSRITDFGIHSVLFILLACGLAGQRALALVVMLALIFLLVLNTLFSKNESLTQERVSDRRSRSGAGQNKSSAPFSKVFFLGLRRYFFDAMIVVSFVLGVGAALQSAWLFALGCALIFATSIFTYAHLEKT